MSNNLSFSLPNESRITFNVKNVYCLGNSGRTQVDIQNHILELEKQGISAPMNTDATIHPISDYLVTQDGNIQVLGNNTTGEIEYLLLINEEGSFITVGSDHADRVLEAQSSKYFKQICQKPIAKVLWPLEEVIGHWDEIKLTCEIMVHDHWELYQEGTVASLLGVEKVIELLQKNNVYSTEGIVVYCGTICLYKGKFMYPTWYRMTMHDPILNRSIILCYNIEILNDIKDKIEIST
ncbi:DUF2848 domain-containing protein [Bacillus sp. FJAT-29790]|uniref:DUF2848 family protein n=1 Tax=Bacillus sp. FJAT-29790 TaxID=1895002 RepID=UPI001C23E633|nr:DUF2848 family protein [Bacillus sp. FJAT-29790]MBU8878198.1 DUF2848 domain-containing protein [Bacillus sp. FJAT-29790]